jgi:sialate O-acetylesterase
LPNLGGLAKVVRGEQNFEQETDKIEHMQNIILVLFISVSLTVFGQVKLPSLVSDGMVLQHRQATIIWGWAKPDEKVRIDTRNKSIKTQADKSGKWQAELPAFAAGGPFDIRINDIVIHNVLWGEVWLCSGQSNMVLPMERIKETYPSEIAQAQNPLIRNFFIPTIISKDIEKDDIPNAKWLEINPENILKMGAVTYFFAQKRFEQTHVPIGIINASVGGSPIESWISESGLKPLPIPTQKPFVSSPAPIEKDRGMREGKKWFDTSYVAKGWKNYFIPGFWEDQGLKDLNGIVWFRKEIDIPPGQENEVGKLFMGRIVDADEMYVNGTRVGNITYQYPPRRYQIKPGILHAGKNLLVIRVSNSAGKGGFVPDKRYELVLGEKTISLVGNWQYKVGDVWTPNPQVSTAQMYQPKTLYQGMISPILPYTLNGILWYQGESNGGDPTNYGKKLAVLAGDWRTKLNQANLPFIYAQLPGFGDRQLLPVESNWAILREEMRQAESQIPNSAMVVTIDQGEWNDIHPLNKKPIGERMALAANQLIEKVASASSGPQIESASKTGNQIILRFKAQGGNPTIDTRNEDELQYFAIAGKDRKFVWAKARIENNMVIITSDEVNEPVYVRYAWSDFPEGNLVNEQGFPASPFEISIN